MATTSDYDIFTNPILDNGADPWVIKAGGYYYYIGSDGNQTIYIIKTSMLQDLSHGEKIIIYTAPEGTDHSCEIWAPELHYINTNWYVYYAADDGRNENHRMFVLQGGTNPDNPLDGTFSFAGKITDRTNRWAIDGTVFMWENTLYFVWSGWEGDENVKQNLYIAVMSDPITIASERVCISTPDQEWEKHGTPWVNEGPEVLIKGNTVHIIYSASGSWTDDYCLARLSCVDDDLMNPKAWVKEGPVFARTNDVFGPGHASFVKSKDDSKDYIVYHAAVRQGSGWERNIRMQLYTWEGEIPCFERPIAAGIMQP